MGIVKNFVDELEKHKLLIYFLIFWGSLFILWTVYRIAEYGFADFGNPIYMLFVDKFYYFSEIVAGLILIIFGLKLLNSNFLTMIKKEKLIVYFILFWAASFFFKDFHHVIHFGSIIFEDLNNVIGFVSAIFGVSTGILLGLFGWKLFKETED